MPTAVTDLMPAISEPVQLTSATLRGINVGASTSRTTLQASPAVSTPCHGSGIAAMGTVVRVSQSGNLLKRSKGHAAFVSQGEGIVVINPTTQRALTSYTLSASLLPVTPPLVVIGNSHQTTFICAQSRTQGGTVELHSWTEAASKRSTAQSLDAHAAHHIAELSLDVASLHPLSSTQILAQCRDGALFVVEFGSLQEPRPHLLDAERAALRTESSNQDSVRIVDTTVLDRMACATILQLYPSRPTGALVITMSSSISKSLESKTRSGRKARKSAMDVIDAAEAPAKEPSLLGTLHLRLTAIDSDGTVRHVGSVEDMALWLGIDGNSEVLSATLHHSGRLSMQFTSGELVSAFVGVSSDGHPSVSDVGRVQLRLPEPSSPSVTRIAELAIVTPSTVFVAVPSSTSAKYACALLVDVELGAVLAETSWRASSSSVGGLYVHRIGGSAVLVLASPAAESAGTRTDAITLYAAPYEAGDGNHLRWAFASRQLSKKWIAPLGNNVVTRKEDERETAQKALLEELAQIAASHNAESGRAMDAAFDRWIVAESGRTAQSSPSHKAKVSFQQSFAQSLASVSLPLPASIAKQADGTKQKSTSYAKQIVHALLDHQALQSTHVTERRLLETLWELHDWEAIIKALRNVTDLDERDIVTVLARSHEKSKAEDNDAMRKMLPFGRLLAIVTDVPVTRTSLRQALKSQVDTPTLGTMLKALSGWLDKHTADSVLQEKPAKPAKKSVKSEGLSEPSLQGTLSFAIDVLDTFFPTLLNDEAFHARISRLANQVQAHLLVLNRLQILRAPLAAFARLEEELRREAEAAAAAREERRLNDDDASEDEHDKQIMNLRMSSRAGKDGAAGNATSHIGGGSMSKYGLPDKSRRLKLKEESLSVGLYQLEQLEL